MGALEKDLLLPYHEQTSRVREGQECLVALYVDKSSRLCATMKVYHYLSTRTPYVTGDSVKGRVYEISDRFGVFVAVDDKYSALIPAREASGKYRPGRSPRPSRFRGERGWQDERHRPSESLHPD